MARIAYQGWVSAVVTALALAGCGTAQESPVDTVDKAKAKPKSRYDLANRCFVLKANGLPAARAGDGYAADAAAGGERFYMKPSGLGRYIFYAVDKAFLTSDGTAVVAAAAPADGSDWTFEELGPGRYTATAAGKMLALDAGGRLVPGATPAELTFESATGCTAYPEMPVGIDGPTFSTRSPQLPVIGFAEVHAHMAMGSEMSDGSGNVGPSAGGVMYGQAMNRFGVIEALKDCEANHGPDGELSPEWLVLDAGTVPPEPQHETAGWPEFVDWPKRDSQLHQQMYYKWVERAYKAGLRTMVIHGTNIEALCNVAKDTGNDKDTDLKDTDCTDMGVGVKQVQYLYDIEKYVDAQEGGPGQGWFRIVRDPAEARSVIAGGKLAVIPGLEFSNIFHCSVTFGPEDAGKDPNEAGTPAPACTKEQIDSEIDRVWDLGVRAVFPFHDVDSALGGTGIFQEAALNVVGFYGTRAFWRTYDCENGGEGPDFFYDAGAYMYNGRFPEGFGSDPISQALIAATGGVLPLYKTGVRQCNARDVTPLGEYAIKKIMQKGFTLDIDHAEIRSKQKMLDWGKETTPNYPAISAHGGHGGINNAQVEQIIKQGGIVYPSIKNGAGMVSFLKKLKARWTASGTTRPLAMGYGADSNGLANLPTPRGAGSTPVVYPFTLFQGEGWSNTFAAARIKPLTVDMLSIPDGQSWDMNEVGMAHYGLIADIVEEIRIEGVEDASGNDADRLGQTEALDAFYNSAETYLQLWEQTLRASEDARTQFTP